MMLVTLGYETSWPQVLKSVSDGMTSLGILGAGAWALFLARRRRSLEPRALLDHHTQLWRFGEQWILRVALEIRNPSEVLIKPGDGNTYVQRAPPPDFDPKGYAEVNWVDIIKIRHCSHE